MKKFLLVTLAMVLGTGAAFAAGGKVNNPWQPVQTDSDECSAFLPPGLDTAVCTEVAVTQSGITYLCSINDVTVQCVEPLEPPRPNNK